MSTDLNTIKANAGARLVAKAEQDAAVSQAQCHCPPRLRKPLPHRPQSMIPPREPGLGAPPQAADEYEYDPDESSPATPGGMVNPAAIPPREPSNLPGPETQVRDQEETDARGPEQPTASPHIDDVAADAEHPGPAELSNESGRMTITSLPATRVHSTATSANIYETPRESPGKRAPRSLD